MNCVSLLFNMFHPHPIHKLQIPSHILHDLIDEFDVEINSKRLKSKINKISDLIDILWKRNLFQTNNSETLSVILNRISHNSHQETIKSYLSFLSHENRMINGTENVYGMLSM